MKQSLKAEVNKFTKGIITEASVLAFPADASLDEENFVLTPTGIRKRRLGMQYEGVYSNNFTSGSLRDRFLWKSPNKGSSKTFVVIAYHNSLLFYDNSYPVLTDGFIQELDTSSLGTSFGSSWRGSSDTKLSSVDGRLIVVRGSGNIGVVEYDGTTFSLTTGRLLVRDQWGVEEATDSDPSIRPSTLTAAHCYNLQNQTWGIPRRGAGTTTEDPVTIFHTEYTSEYPSNSDVVWSALQYAPVDVATQPYERVYPKLFKESFNGGIAAAKGYFIIDLLDRGTSREASYLANVAKYPTFTSFASISVVDDISTGGPSLIASMSGRVFYSGFFGDTTSGDKRSPTLNNCVVFSQVIKSRDDAFKCYQEGDPTSRENADIVDTDGGFIKIAETNVIRAIATYRDSLVVFGDQGIWRISGGGEYGFTASNYKADKISDKVIASPDALVSLGGDIMFWGMDGIYMITKNQLAETVVNNISISTIQSLYSSLSEATLYGAVGNYCPYDKIVRWLYTVGDSAYELCFNVAFSAFTKNRIYGVSAGKQPASLFTRNELSAPTYIFVEDNYSEGVLIGKRFRFAKTSSTDFLDFTTDAFAFLQTGHQTASDSSVDKQIPYLVMHFTRTEEGVDVEGVPLKQSSCMTRCKWAWADSSVSNKWSRVFQAYKERKPLFSDEDYESGFQIITSKSKLRGRGKAFSLYFETEPGKDCQPVGWSLTVNGNANT
jgi:hypothetical protein